MPIISFTATIKADSTKDYNYSLMSNSEWKETPWKVPAHPHVPFQLWLTNFTIFLCLWFIYVCCGVVICGGETPSIFLFLNDLVSNRQPELPEEQLVCIVIRPGNHISEAVTASLILFLTGSMLLFLLWWISHFYICSICKKCLFEHEQASMEDMQNTPCIGPQ